MKASGSMSKMQWLIAVLVVLVVAFIGSMAGSWFAGWRQDNAHREKLEKLYSKSPANILIGDTFPEVELIDVDGKYADLEKLIEGHKTLVFFLAPTCDMCTDLIDAYRRESEGFSTGLKALAVCPDIPDMARAYADEHDLPFPIYCDTAQSFQSEHGVVAFPTLMALDTRGVIRYMNFGMMEDYDFGDILDMLKQF
jgi:peroxiredoxin